MVIVALVVASFCISPLAATAAVSPEEEWLTDVTGTYQTSPAVMTFGSSGITAALGPTASRCGGTANEASHAVLISRLAQDYYSPQAPADGVGVAECLSGGGTGSRTVVLSKPIAGLMFHVQNLDASYVDFQAGPSGGAVALQLVKSNVALQLQNAGTRLINGPVQGTANCTNDAAASNNPGCGSFRMTEDGGVVSSFSFVNNTRPGSAADGWFWSLSFHQGELTKEFLPATIPAGGISALTFTVTNPAGEGAVPFEDIAFSDGLPAGVMLANSTTTATNCGTATINGGSPAAGDTAVSVSGATVAVGEACMVTVNVTGQAVGTYVNTNDNVTTSIGNILPSATATLEVVAPAPSLSLVKSGVLTTDVNGNSLADLGDEITYTFDVENTGNTPVRDIAITDPKVTGTTPATADLLPTESVEFVASPYVVTRGDVLFGSVVNSATAEGIYDSLVGDQAVLSNESGTTLDVGDAPSLTIDKTGTLEDENGNRVADEGERILYAFDVTNTGNVVLDEVSVIDDLITGLLPASIDGLTPAATVRFTAEPYVISAADVARGEIVNVATATAMSPSGIQVESLEGSVTTPVLSTPPPTPPSGLANTGARPADSVALGAALLGLGIAVALVASFRRRSSSLTPDARD